ncbi:unnamed protein product [Strongylus vulgaris]|uniref:Uncharacterized protein n=1 Tax=Strongylus vulgaris TaxID=40348 RepID=A0A3P7JKQ7_STRVU|nr:unnamed protein product [Strongylus vulgaris]
MGFFSGAANGWLWLDARLDLLNVSPLAGDVWPLRVVSAARPLFYTSFTIKRRNKATSWDGYVFALLLRMRGSVAENKRLMKNEEGDEAVLHWEIRRSGGNGTQELIHKVATKFRVVPDSVYALVPVAKAVLHWEIRRSGGNGTQELIHKVATKFRVVPDSIYALVPVAKVRDLGLNLTSTLLSMIHKSSGNTHMLFFLIIKTFFLAFVCEYYPGSPSLIHFSLLPPLFG